MSAESKGAAPKGAATERNAQGVDVLAVMDRALRDLIDDDYATTDSPWANDFREALAAVAELLTAAAKAAVALNNYRATGKPDYEALTNASDALNPALAPFQAGGAE